MTDEKIKQIVDKNYQKYFYYWKDAITESIKEALKEENKEKQSEKNSLCESPGYC